MILLSKDRAIPDDLVKHSGEFMGDERSERKIPLWIWARLGALALIGSCIGQAIWHGSKVLSWDDVLVPAFGVIMAIWLLLVGQRNKITTLGIGEATEKKLR